MSKRTPTIVIASLCVSLLSDWVDAPAWLPNGFAVIVAGLALVLFASKRRRQFSNADELEPSTSSDWLAHELAGQGSPAGSYLLGFFSIVTIVLTGVQSAFAMPAWAGLALSIVWAIVNASYPEDVGFPADEGSEP